MNLLAIAQASRFRFDDNNGAELDFEARIEGNGALRLSLVRSEGSGCSNHFERAYLAFMAQEEAISLADAFTLLPPPATPKSLADLARAYGLILADLENVFDVDLAGMSFEGVFTSLIHAGDEPTWIRDELELFCGR